MKKTISISFVAILVFGLIINIFAPKKDFSENENRSLATFPNFNISDLLSGKYFEEIGNFASDQFILRDFWVSQKAYSEKAMGKGENNGVYFADDYLIQKPAIDNAIITNNTKTVLNVAKKSGLKTNLVVIPTAFGVYEEKLPKNVDTNISTNAFNIISSLTKNNNVCFLDMQNLMKSHKNEYIYFRTDHHQTTLASYYIYQAMSKDLGYSPLNEEDFEVKTLTNDFYGTNWSKAMINIKPDTITEYKCKKKIDYEVAYPNEKTNSFLNYDNLKKKDKYTVFFNGNFPIVKVHSSINNGEKLLLIKDSYANTIVPFLANNYEDIYMIDLRYYNNSLKNLIEENSINNICFLFNINSFGTDKSISKASMLF